jgi:Leucine-rich repeat (LRR) protein
VIFYTHHILIFYLFKGKNASPDLSHHPKVVKVAGLSFHLVSTFHIYISIFIYILPPHQSSTSQAIIQYQYPTNPVPLNMRKLFFSILILSVFLFSKKSALPHNNVTDLAALLSFKSQVYDPTGTLDSSWLTNTSFCKWIGVNCSAKGQRVIALSLKGLSLSGTISPMLGNLSFIKGLNIHNNSLTGSIPDSLGNLPRLTYLELSNNMLTGNIPSSIFNISLEYFRVVSNNLSGPLLVSNTSILTPKLQRFSVEKNHFTGILPLGLSRCTNLEFLSFSSNQFTGSIPLELHNLVNLKVLYLDDNNLTGKIPLTLGNLTGLIEMDLSTNHFSGHVPGELGSTLKNLQWLSIAENALTGSISFLLNFTNLAQVDLSVNNFTGTIPASLGKDLPVLYQLYILGNQLSGTLDFIDSLSNCKSLNALVLSYNNLEGSIPISVRNLSKTFQTLRAERNLLSGAIPSEISNMTNLLALDLVYNKLTGNIPTSIGKMKKLQMFYVGMNTVWAYTI